MDILKIIAIKTKNKVFISDDITGSEYYTKLGGLLFDGKAPNPTYAKTWFWVDKIPEKVEEKLQQEQTNIRFELREGFPPTNETPAIINKPYIDEDDEYYEVRGIYDKKYDLLEARIQEVKFQITILDELENFQPIKTDFPIQSGFIDKLSVHPIMLPLLPCKLSVQDTYNIIRKYVKENIDHEWAVITSDYDFCFTVKKRIVLDEPTTYQVDIANQGWSRRKRKPKMETRYRKTREVEIFEMAPKPYQSYHVIQAFEGISYEDLKSKIEKFLNELIEKINAPLEDCPTCKGMGIIPITK